jgi:transposase
MYVAMDVSKERIAVAIAEGGRRGEVRFYGTIASSAEAVARLVGKLSAWHPRLCFCYEAGPTGYGLYRQIRTLGHECQVVAPSMVPVRPGGQIKTDRRDASALAVLLRAGELTPIWVPDDAHEAMRDLVRARSAAMQDVRRARQQLLSFLLRHGHIHPTRRHWTRAHRRWLAEQRFEHVAQQIVFEELIGSIEHAEQRRDRLEQQMRALVPDWSLAPVVAAIQALRGVATICAITLVAEIGDFHRFVTPRQLMAWLGLVPRERSSGATTARGAITKAGNGRPVACWSKAPGPTVCRHGSVVTCSTAARHCPRTSGRSPGRPRSACVGAIAACSAPAARSTSSPSPSPASSPPSSGRSRPRWHSGPPRPDASSIATF